jgi:hypothetical protein
MGAPKRYPAGRPYILEGELRGVWRELGQAATQAEAMQMFEGAPAAFPNYLDFRVRHLDVILALNDSRSALGV